MIGQAGRRHLCFYLQLCKKKYVYVLFNNYLYFRSINVHISLLNLLLHFVQLVDPHNEFIPLTTNSA